MTDPQGQLDVRGRCRGFSLEHTQLAQGKHDFMSGLNVAREVGKVVVLNGKLQVEETDNRLITI